MNTSCVCFFFKAQQRKLVGIKCQYYERDRTESVNTHDYILMRKNRIVTFMLSIMIVRRSLHIEIEVIYSVFFFVVKVIIYIRL